MRGGPECRLGVCHSFRKKRGKHGTARRMRRRDSSESAGAVESGMNESIAAGEREGRDRDEAHEGRVVARRRQMDGTGSACRSGSVPVGSGNRLLGQRPGCEHDDSSGNGVSGEWAGGHRNADVELAVVYDS